MRFIPEPGLFSFFSSMFEEKKLQFPVVFRKSNIFIVSSVEINGFGAQWSPNHQTMDHGPGSLRNQSMLQKGLGAYEVVSAGWTSFDPLVVL